MDHPIYRHLSDGGLWAFAILLVVLGTIALAAGLSGLARRGYI